MATTQEVLDLLGGVGVFEGLGADDLSRIQASTKQVTFEAGDEIIRKGGRGGHLYLVLDGEAEVEIDDTRRRKLGRGDYFGEMSLIDGQPRSATVRATSPVTALTLTSFDFQPLLAEHPSIALKMLETMSRKLREAIGES